MTILPLVKTAPEGVESGAISAYEGGDGSRVIEAGRARPHLQLLHHFELRCADVPAELPESAQRLLAFLAVRARPQHRATVAGVLWTDTTEERAAASLRTALWRARRVDSELVVSKGAYLSIGPGVDVDLAAVLERAHRLLDGPAGGPPVAELSPESLVGDLLPEWYDDWVLLERERLRQVRLHSLEMLCARLTLEGRFALAIEAGLVAAAAEPLRESARRVLMAAHLAEGNVAEAVHEYDTFAALLRESLGIEPTDSLRRLVAPCR